MAKAQVNYEDDFTVEDETLLSRLEEKNRSGTTSTDAYDALSFLPVTGEAIAAYELPGILSQSGKMIQSKDFLEAAAGTGLATLGVASVLPGVGPVARYAKKGLESFIPYLGPKTAVAGGPDVDSSIMKMDNTSSGGGAKPTEKPKLKKDPNEDGAYLLNLNGKEYKISKFYDEDDVHRGEWSIFERAPATEYTDEGWDWMDTVTTRGYALERIKEIDAAKQVEVPVKKEPSQVEMDFTSPTSKTTEDLNLGSGSLFSPEVKKGRKLLIVSCSADKCPDPDDMEAFDRYTGDMFKSIKKQGIPEENVDLAIMSAKYGLIRRDTKIPTYNVKMNKEIANNLLNDPIQVDRIKNTIEGYDEVVVEGSNLYKGVIKEAAGDAPLTDFKIDYEKNLPKGERSNYGSGRQKQSVGNFLRSNTPQDVFHYTPDAELGFTVFDPDKATNALDALGTHVGTAKAASDRYEKTFGKGFALGSLAYDKSGVPIARTTRGGTYPLKADVSKPYTPDKFYEGQVSGIGPSKEVWGESDIYGHLLDEYNKNRGTRYTMRAMSGDEPDFPFSDFRKFIGQFRKKLANDGFTHLPYYNEVEDYGSISYVMLTDRPKGSKAVLKGKFGKNDPKERTNPDIMKEDGGVVSLKDKAVNMNRGPRGIEPFIKFMV